MIKKIMKWIKNLFKKVEETDSHPEVKVEKIKCTTHYPRYKKSCTVCRATEKE